MVARTTSIRSASQLDQGEDFVRGMGAVNGRRVNRTGAFADTVPIAGPPRDRLIRLMSESERALWIGLFGNTERLTLNAQRTEHAANREGAS